MRTAPEAAQVDQEATAEREAVAPHLADLRRLYSRLLRLRDVGARTVATEKSIGRSARRLGDVVRHFHPRPKEAAALTQQYLEGAAEDAQRDVYRHLAAADGRA